MKKIESKTRNLFSYILIVLGLCIIITNAGAQTCPILSLSGGGEMCAGGTSLIVLGRGSLTTVSYQLYKNNVAYGAPKNGGGPDYPLVWSVTDVGTYTVKALTSPCSNTLMSGSIVVANPSGTLSIMSVGSIPNYVCPNNNFKLRALGGTNYSWRFGTTSTTPNPTILSTAIEYTPTQSGWYFLDGKNCAGANLTGTKIQVYFAPPSDFVQNLTAPSGALQRCQAQEVNSYTVTAQNAYNYTWSVSPANAGEISGTGTTGTISWNSSFTGTATISVLASGCGTATSSTNVTVGAPSVSKALYNGTQTRCQGSDTSDYTALSLNSIGAEVSSFTWSISPTQAGQINGTGKTATVTWSTTFNGIAYIDVQPNGCNPPLPTSIPVTIKPNLGTPSVPTGSKSLCQGHSLSTYITQAANATSYDWSISPADAGSITGADQKATVEWNSSFAGIANISVTARGCGDAKATSTTSVNINSGTSGAAVPVPSGPASRCMAGETTVYTMSTGNTTAYSWSITPENAGTINDMGSAGNVIWSPFFNGTAVITARYANCSGSSSLAVSVLTSETTEPVGVSKRNMGSGTSVYTSSSESATVYTWSIYPTTAGTISGTGTSGTVTWNSAFQGTALINVQGTNGCGGASATTTKVVYVENPALGIKNNNYVIKSTTLVSGVTQVITDLSDMRISSTLAYCDGLGRTVQSVMRQGSPLNKDIVQPIVFDSYGRQTRKYLPFASGNDGSYKTVTYDPNTGNYTGAVAGNFYSNNASGKIAQDARPFSETIFEAAPYDRPLKDYGTGAEWAAATAYNSNGKDKPVQHQYLTIIHGTTANTTQEKVINWKVDVSGMPVRNLPILNYIEAGGYYSTGQLFIKQTKDEQGDAVREYTDKTGHIILKKVQVLPSSNLNSTTEWALTYYIYDDLGNLRYVLQPELSKKVHAGADTYVITTTDLANFAFQYKYDGKKRMTEKQVPGAGVVYMVYDNLDRVVLTQDANQRAGATNAIKYWSFTKYDEFNRPILTGIKDTTTTVQLTQAEMQGVVDNYYALMLTTKPWRKYGETYVSTTAAGNVHGYSNNSYPQVTMGALLDANNYLTVTYYDNYAFRAGWYGTYTYVTDNLSAIVASVTYAQPATGSENINVVGQVTGAKTKVLDGGVAGGCTWLKSIAYYDNKYRVIQTQADNYKGGVDRVSNLYHFTGKILTTKSTHIESDVTWKDQVGVLLTGNKLIRNSTSTAGAASAQQLLAGQDGWMEFTVSEINTTRYIGLNDTNPDVNATNINYAFKLTNSTLTVVENNGAARATVTGIKSGDVLRIQRTGTVVKYYRNGFEIPISPASTASSTVLMADVSFSTNNATFVDVRTSFSTNTKSITRRFDYDHADRLLRIWHQIDTQPEILLAYNEYNELGQLIDKKLHSTVAAATDAKQSVDYRYNIRGWMTSINNSELTNDGITNDDTGDYFGMNLGYHTDIGIGNSTLFNGNISAVKWSKNQGLSTTKENAYVYTYDALNRITTSSFREKATSWAIPANNIFAETGFTYDLNGNIKALQRNDKRTSGLMDNLAYDYGAGTAFSNKLLKVSDIGDKTLGFIDGTNTGNDYTYDGNGNMITDQNKGIITAIAYNFLNLPELITKAGTGGNNVRYIYDASGRKLAQIVTFGGIQKQTDYAGEYHYENDVLQFIGHEEGRIVLLETQLIYTDGGDATTNIIAATPTTILSTVIQNGTEKYVKAVSNDITTRSGMFPIGGTINVTAGERYRIRAKGYRDKGTAASSSAAYLLIKVGTVDLNWPGASLPVSLTTASTETWIEQIVTIPTGATTLQAGVVWNTVLAGEVIYLNEFEITKLIVFAAPEYQYNLKDHLGNVRVTFTTKSETEVATATLEASNATAERSKFLRYDNARVVNHHLFDRTNGSLPSTNNGGAQRLNGQANEIYGLARSVSVMPGDVIDMEVYAKYIDSNSGNRTVSLNNLISQIAAGTAPAGTVVDGSTYTTSTSSFPFAPGQNGTGNSTGTGPKAYLNWLVFDRDYNLIVSKSGYKRMTTIARETGQDVAHEKLSGSVTIGDAGYVYIYLSNEEGAGAYECYFDDFKVTQTKSPVIANNDYYSFGLTFNSYKRENSLENKHLFTGKEKQDALGLDWYDHGARMYDASIGRWMVSDPLSHKMRRWSPYAYAFDNPVRFIDPEGMAPYTYNWDKKRYENESGQEVQWSEVHQSLQDNGDLQTGMAIFVAFPDANPDIPSNQGLAKWGEKTFGDGDGKVNGAGHAGVVLINDKGETNYFDFGRYDRPDVKGRKRGKDEGAVRSSLNYGKRLAVPNWDFGKSDNENVTAILTKLHSSPLLAGYGRIVGALAKNLNYGAMLAYARGAEAEGYLPFGGYTSGYNYCNSATYCAKFARGVGDAGGFDWDWNTFTGMGNVGDIMEEYEVESITLPPKR